MPWCFSGGKSAIIHFRLPPSVESQLEHYLDPAARITSAGHAARAILIAILAIGMGPWWLALIICLWAPLVSLARVAMGVHYLSDIVGGVVVGGIAGIIALQFR